MPCIEGDRIGLRSWRRLLPALAVGLLAACAPMPAPVPAPMAPPRAAEATEPLAPPVAALPASAPLASAATSAALAPATLPRTEPLAPLEPPLRPPRYVKLGPPATPRSPEELRLQMAERLMAAHPDTTYTGPVPDRLLAIPVLEIELNADGSVRHVRVVRRPTTGDEAIELAIAAVHRAAPYGNVSRLPKPWKVVETFLFDDDLHFKPRTLDR